MKPWQLGGLLVLGVVVAVGLAFAGYCLWWNAFYYHV